MKRATAPLFPRCRKPALRCMRTAHTPHMLPAWPRASLVAGLPACTAASGSPLSRSRCHEVAPGGVGRRAALSEQAPRPGPLGRARRQGRRTLSSATCHHRARRCKLGWRDFVAPEGRSDDQRGVKTVTAYAQPATLRAQPATPVPLCIQVCIYLSICHSVCLAICLSIQVSLAQLSGYAVARPVSALTPAAAEEGGWAKKQGVVSGQL